MRPEDDKSLYAVVPTRRGNNGPIEWMLPHKDNGDCIYLSAGNFCSIWNHAPAACREFDCRKWWAGFSKAEKLHVMHDLDSAVAQAAKERL